MTTQSSWLGMLRGMVAGGKTVSTKALSVTRVKPTFLGRVWRRIADLFRRERILMKSDRRLAVLGLKTYLAPHAITGHVGSSQQIQNLPLLAASGLGVRNMKFLETA